MTAKLRFFKTILKRCRSGGGLIYTGRVGEGWARDVMVHYNPPWNDPHPSSDREYPGEWVAQFGSLTEGRGPTPQDAVRSLEAATQRLATELAEVVKPLPDQLPR